MSDSAAHVVFGMNSNYETLNFRSSRCPSLDIVLSPTWNQDSVSDIGCLPETWNPSKKMLPFSGTLTKICSKLRKWLFPNHPNLWISHPKKNSPENDSDSATREWSSECGTCSETSTRNRVVDLWELEEQRSEIYEYPEEFINVYFDKDQLYHDE